MRNSLKSDLAAFKAAGFEGGNSNSLSRNPYLRLNNGNCLLGIAGKLVGVVTTKTHFGTHQNLKQWKSSNGNNPDATLTSTQTDADGVGKHTEIYYREAHRDAIRALAAAYGVDEEKIVGDHVNHLRGDCRDENIEFGTSRQNNQNRSKVKITKAFYTLEEALVKLDSGEWVKA